MFFFVFEYVWWWELGKSSSQSVLRCHSYTHKHTHRHTGVRTKRIRIAYICMLERMDMCLRLISNCLCGCVSWHHLEIKISMLQYNGHTVHKNGFRSKTLTLRAGQHVLLTWTPIEFLWGIFARKLYEGGHQYHISPELKKPTHDEWASIDNSQLCRLVEILREPIFQVIARRCYKLLKIMISLFFTHWFYNFTKTVLVIFF